MKLKKYLKSFFKRRQKKWKNTSLVNLLRRFSPSLWQSLPNLKVAKKNTRFLTSVKNLSVVVQTLVIVMAIDIALANQERNQV